MPESPAYKQQYRVCHRQNKTLCWSPKSSRCPRLPSLHCMPMPHIGNFRNLFLRPFLLRFTGELYDFASDSRQFECHFLQFGDHRKGFLLRKIAFQSDYSLVIIHPDTAKLPVQSRQFLIIIEQRAIHFYHPKGFR